MRRAFYLFDRPEGVLDGRELQGGDGRHYEVYCAPWWRLDRWIAWWMSRGKVKGEVVILWAGGKRSVRVLEVD